MEEQSITALFLVALSEDGPERDDAIIALHKLGNQEVFDIAKELLNSNSPVERATGVDILVQLGVPERSFPEETIAVLLDLIAEEQSPDVLAALCVGFGHLKDRRIVPALLQHKNHKVPAVRRGVVIGLSGYNDEESVSALIELSRDDDVEVRNWATFGLGSQMDGDSEFIRDALLDRLNDVDNEIRGEAFVGLAHRMDKKAIPKLIDELSSNEVGTLAVEAAGEFGDSRLLPYLEALEKWWDVDQELLEEAIENCAKKKDRDNPNF